MKTPALPLAALLLLIRSLAHADIDIASKVGVEAAPDGSSGTLTSSLAGFLRVDADSFRLPTDNLSFFYAGSGEIGFTASRGPAGGELATALDGTLRGGPFFGRLSLTGSLDWEGAGSAPSVLTGSELYTSAGNLMVSLFASVGADYYWNDGLLTFPLSAGCSWAPVVEFVVTGRFDASPSPGDPSSGVSRMGPSLECSFYPELPFTLEGRAGYYLPDGTPTGGSGEPWMRLSVDCTPAGSFSGSLRFEGLLSDGESGKTFSFSQDASLKWYLSGASSLSLDARLAVETESGAVALTAAGLYLEYSWKPWRRAGS